MFDPPRFALFSPTLAFDAPTFLPDCQRSNTVTAL
jgi:hypothetical protein